MAVLIARLNDSQAAAEADEPQTGVVERKSADDLSAAELARLREAFRRVYALIDERGYQYHAGVHGLPLPVYCPHGNILFTIWHRPYIYFFEKALQDVVPNVSLPYWTWDSPRTPGRELPTAFTEPTGADGQPNPLLASDITFTGMQFPRSVRDVGAAGILPRLGDLARRAQRERTYQAYNLALENPHNGLHGYVGGTMGRVDYAAYDPLFWAHHANVDRLFAEWQTLHPSDPPAAIANTVLRPFNVTVRDVWDTRRLGYSYAPARRGRPFPAAPPPTRAAAEGATVNPRAKDGTPVASFSVRDIAESSGLAHLQLNQVKHPKDSFEIRVFLNTPSADEKTPTTDNPNYAGSFFVFGHGICQGSAGHCDPPAKRPDPFDLRAPHHLEPFQLSLEATESIRTALANSRAESADAEVSVTLVAVDMKGNLIPNPGIDFDEVALLTE